MKAAARRGEFPRELDICLTDACNLDCSYCYFGAKRRRDPSFLSFEDIERALDLYLERIRPERVQKLSFSGGEPMLCFDTLLAALRLARRRLGPRPNIEIFTNGTLLTRERAKKLLRFDPVLMISIDGPGAVCDANRKFYRGGRSVYAAVERNIRDLGGPVLSRCSAGATFDRRTAGRMAGSAGFLLGKGFGGVVVDLDVLAQWDTHMLGLLKREAVRLKALYEANMSCGFGDVRQPLRFDFITPREELPQIAAPSGLKEISLSPDGGFYPSGLIATYGPGKERYRLGGLREGFDDGKMGAALKELRGYFGRNRLAGYNGCPSHVYFSRRLKNMDPAIALRSGERLFKALDPILGPVVDFELALNRLASLEGFGDFDHLPKESVPDAGLAELEVSGLKPCAAREAMDSVLYGPSVTGRILFSWDGDGSSEERIKLFSLYAMMKARRLGRALKLFVFARRVPPGARLAEFMLEHGIDLVLPASLAGKTPASMREKTWLYAAGAGACRMRRLAASGKRRYWFFLETGGEAPRRSELEAFAGIFAGRKIMAADLLRVSSAGGRRFTAGTGRGRKAEGTGFEEGEAFFRRACLSSPGLMVRRLREFSGVSGLFRGRLPAGFKVK